MLGKCTVWMLLRACLFLIRKHLAIFVENRWHRKGYELRNAEWTKRCIGDKQTNWKSTFERLGLSCRLLWPFSLLCSFSAYACWITKAAKSSTFVNANSSAFYTSSIWYKATSRVNFYCFFFLCSIWWTLQASHIECQILSQTVYQTCYDNNLRRVIWFSSLACV